MTILPLLLSLCAPVRANPHDHAGVYAPGPIETELPRYKRKRSGGGTALLPGMAEALKKASPRTQALVSLFAKKQAERCGVCEPRIDAAGVHCLKRSGLYDNCGHGCGEEILLVPAAALSKTGLESKDGALAVGELRSLIEYAAARNGFGAGDFLAPPIATCR